MVKVEQYVMAYRADHDAIKKLLPEGFESLRPVLRVNAEIVIDEEYGDEFVNVEFNTPVEAAGMRGWLNLITWESGFAEIHCVKGPQTTSFTLCYPDGNFLDVDFTRTGKEGGCPHEEDNEGTFYIDEILDETSFMEVEEIDSPKEYCEAAIEWNTPEYEFFDAKDDMVRYAMDIPVEEILGAYVVEFEREFDY